MGSEFWNDAVDELAALVEEEAGNLEPQSNIPSVSAPEEPEIPASNMPAILVPKKKKKERDEMPALAE